MHRKSILRSLKCDPKTLPIGALEAFVLSQVQQHAVAEDVAEATGLELSELFRVARHLVELGALSVDGEKVKAKRPTVHPAKKAPTLHPQPGKAQQGLLPAALVPKPRKHADLRSLGIGPIEGFLLSQIDGTTSVADLGEITGLSEQDLSTALRALEAAGTVDLGMAKRRPSMSGARAKVTDPPPASARAAPAKPAAPATPATPEIDACDLPEADRARITETEARLHTLDFYGVLGIERDADPKAIRRAYHALAGQFHPDRFFGKKLGPFRRPLERIFMRLTLAYDTLSKPGKRAEYGATLPPRPSKRALTQKPPASVRRPPTQKTAPVRSSSRQNMRSPAPAVSAVQSRPVVTPAAPVAAPPRPPTPAPAPPSAASGGSNMDSSRRAPSQREHRAPQERALVFVRAAEDALDRHDFVAAANNYRLAVQCSDDPALRVALEETDVKARRRVRETTLAAATAAEQAGRWAEAGEKYAKAHAAKPEARVAERAANAMRLGGADLRTASRLAEQAVLAEPNNAAFRVTLGEIYFDAGLLARAAGESARAMALAPNDLRASALAKLVAKGKRA